MLLVIIKSLQSKYYDYLLHNKGLELEMLETLIKCACKKYCSLCPLDT